MNEKTRVLLADAADDFRRMAAEMIGQEEDMAVVGQTGDGEELLRLVRTLRPQVVVMDLVLSGLDGLGVLAQLGPERPRVLVLSGVTAREDLRTFAFRPSAVLDGVGDIAALARAAD